MLWTVVDAVAYGLAGTVVAFVAGAVAARFVPFDRTLVFVVAAGLATGGASSVARRNGPLFPVRSYGDRATGVNRSRHRPASAKSR